MGLAQWEMLWSYKLDSDRAGINGAYLLQDLTPPPSASPKKRLGLDPPPRFNGPCKYGDVAFSYRGPDGVFRLTAMFMRMGVLLSF